MPIRGIAFIYIENENLFRVVLNNVFDPISSYAYPEGFGISPLNAFDIFGKGLLRKLFQFSFQPKTELRVTFFEKFSCSWAYRTVNISVAHLLLEILERNRMSLLMLAHGLCERLLLF